MRRCIILVATIYIGISLAGCERTSKTENAIEKTEIINNNKVNIKLENTIEFIAILEKAGYKIKATKQQNQGFLSGDFTIINIDGDSIGAYEYKTNEEVEQETHTIGSDGSKIGNRIYQFISKPHFYKNGNIIVSYFGDNQETIKKIEDLTGEQFAGMT